MAVNINQLKPFFFTNMINTCWTWFIKPYFLQIFKFYSMLLI